MRQLLILVYIGTALYFCFAGAALAQEHEEMDMDIERAKRHLELEEMNMELEQRRAEMRHENELREMERVRRRAEMKRFEKGRRKPPKEKFMPLILICLVVHILVAIWVYQDIRARNTGSGLWIVIALLTGLLGALVYAVVRLGDIKKQT